MGIQVKDLFIKYGDKIALKKVNLDILDGEILTFIGPNGSGKSTLIKSITRIIKPSKGNILFNNKDIFKISTKELAREIAILPQEKDTFSDISVEELVSFGRYPHLSFGKGLSSKDKAIVEKSLVQTGMEGFKDRLLSTLSGGERQRAWIAMALAQEPKVLIMDEPTTYLDISYQMEVLNLVQELNKNLNLTVVLVLHDLNQAIRYSHKICVLQDGEVIGYGAPQDVIQAPLLKRVFNIESHIYEDKINNCTYFIPHKSILRS